MIEIASTLSRARVAASEAAARVSMAPVETVSFATRGVVLVTGQAERVLSVLHRLPDPLRVVAFVPDAGGADVARSGARIVAAPITAVSGHLGHFSASTVPVDGAPVDAGRFG